MYAMLRRAYGRERRRAWQDTVKDAEIAEGEAGRHRLRLRRARESRARDLTLRRAMTGTAKTRHGGRCSAATARDLGWERSARRSSRVYEA